ncbi:MAG: methylenetetrahydrofolate reductase [NAD(P)H], partial [Clostridiaceae bacterium]|nr:methylenetetrahydrofolate reductase [NAD(P)H] [Clostridiaceae bacterium]
QIRDLIDNGVKGVHINTMNRVDATYSILKNIGRL